MPCLERGNPDGHRLKRLLSPRVATWQPVPRSISLIMTMQLSPSSISARLSLSLLAVAAFAPSSKAGQTQTTQTQTTQTQTTQTQTTQAQTAKKRNVLIIHTDEHHYGTLGCYGGKIVGTPHIDSIAKNGALCTSFYATTPVCSPSRAALISGLYPQKTLVVTNNVRMDGSVVTLAELLKQQGYATGYAGKWHLDGPGKPQWAPPRRFGFSDNRFMFNRGHWKQLVDTPQGPRVGSRNNRGQPTYALNGANQTTFTTDWLCNKAIQFIKAHRDEPWFYMVSLPDPHGPNTVRAPYDTMYAQVEVPIPPSLKKNPEQTPGWGRPANITAARLRKIMPLYYGMVKCIDDNVGRILETLSQENLFEDTLIIFTSDHGDLCGQHGRLNKGVPYEGSARIPFVISCPGRIRPGVVIDEALSCVDVLPTVMGLLQIKLQRPVDGRDASPLLLDMQTVWDDVAFLRSTPGTPWLCCVTSRYKLIFSAADHPWLIDLQQDPQELTNLFQDAQHEGVALRLTAKLRNYCREHQDVYARVPAIKEALEHALQKKSQKNE